MRRAQTKGIARSAAERTMILCRFMSALGPLASRCTGRNGLAVPYPGEALLYSVVRGHRTRFWVHSTESVYPLTVSKELFEMSADWEGPLNSSHDKEPYPYHGTSGLTARMMTCPRNRTGFVSTECHIPGHAHVTHTHT
jgi:hypothetical protein